MPTTATIRSGQNQVTVANPIPVSVINTAAASSSARSANRCDVSPKPSVSAAEPSRVPVTIAPDLDRREAEAGQVLREQDADEAVGERAHGPRDDDPLDVAAGSVRAVHGVGPDGIEPSTEGL